MIEKMKKRLTLILVILFLFPIYALAYANTRSVFRIQAQTRRRLKYFNPIIKKGILGDEYIEWIGREKPITDEEVELLIKNT